MLDREINYYRKNKEKLKKLYSDKYIIIKGNEIIGTYDTHAIAYHEARKNHEVGTFIIKYITMA